MEKIVKIGEREVKLKATAAIPRLYRIKFRRDIIRDMTELHKAFNSVTEKGGELDVMQLTIFENVAYIMAKHADPQNVPDSMDEWLDGFEMFSIYVIMPEIIGLWGLNEETTVESKKKFGQLTEK